MGVAVRFPRPRPNEEPPSWAAADEPAPGEDPGPGGEPAGVRPGLPEGDFLLSSPTLSREWTEAPPSGLSEKALLARLWAELLSEPLLLELAGGVSEGGEQGLL